MVDEVKIKATLDTSGVSAGVRDIKSQFKALHSDSKVLGEFVGDFEKAFKRFGGYMPEQAKKAFKGIKNLSQSISEDEENIAKQSKIWLKNSQKSEKAFKSIGKTFRGLGKIFSAGMIIGAVKKAVSISEEGRQDVYMAQKLGISGEKFEAISSSFSALGVNVNSLNDALQKMRDATLGAKYGVGNYEQVMSALGFFGISDALNKTPEQLLYDLADWAELNPNEYGAFQMRTRLGIGQDVFNQLKMGGKALREEIAKAPEKLGSLSEEALKQQTETANKWSEAVTIFKNAVDSWTTGYIGDFIRQIAYWVSVIGGFMKIDADEYTGEKAKKANAVLLESKMLALETATPEDRLKWLSQRKNPTEEDVLLALGKLRNKINYVYYTNKGDIEEANKYLRQDSLKNAWMEEHPLIDYPENYYDEEGNRIDIKSIPNVIYSNKKRRKINQDEPPRQVEKFTVEGKQASLIGSSGNVINLNVDFEQQINGGSSKEVYANAYDGVVDAFGDTARDLVNNYG